MIDNNKNSGFSLIEVLVAISILLLILANPMQILKRAGNSTQYASEQSIAYFLAQEGVELVQKGRDDLLLQYFRGEFGLSGTAVADPMSQMVNVVSPAPLRHCIVAASGPGTNNRCGIDARFISTPNTVVDCRSTQANCALYLASSGQSRFTHSASGNSTTPYRRFIKIEKSPATGVPDELKVTVSVEWRTGSLVAGQKVELVTYLENIYATN